jgi:hypothetical protein
VPALPRQNGQKFFASFFQKRSASLPSLPPPLQKPAVIGYNPAQTVIRE